jgi:hypothetical protein
MSRINNQQTPQRRQQTPQRRQQTPQRKYQRHSLQRYHSYLHPRYSRPYNYHYNYRGPNYFPIFYTGIYDSDVLLLDNCMNIMTDDATLKYKVKDISNIKSENKEETVRVKISRCFDQFIIEDKLYLLDSYPSLLNAYNIYMA